MIPRFFVDVLNRSDPRVLLGPKESFHAVRVLRLKVGDAVEVFDGRCACAGFIVSRGREGVTVGLAHGRDGSEDSAGGRNLSFELDLVFSLIKSDAADLLIQKACELGAGAIYPVTTERSVVRLSADRLESKVARWNKIAVAACKQCGRSAAPRIVSPQTLDGWLKRAGEYDRVFIPTLALGAVRSFYAAARALNKPRKVALLIGPEGDFTEAEARAATGAGAVAVSLGSIVMRAETAALYALSALHFYYGGQNGEESNVD